MLAYLTHRQRVTSFLPHSRLVRVNVSLPFEPERIATTRARVAGKERVQYSEIAVDRPFTRSLDLSALPAPPAGRRHARATTRREDGYLPGHPCGPWPAVHRTYRFLARRAGQSGQTGVDGHRSPGCFDVWRPGEQKLALSCACRPVRSMRPCHVAESAVPGLHLKERRYSRDGFSVPTLASGALRFSSYPPARASAGMEPSTTVMWAREAVAATGDGQTPVRARRLCLHLRAETW
jgi:hypothetical protein